MSLPVVSNLNIEEMTQNPFLKFISKCYLHVIFIVMFILFLIEFFYLFKKNPDDLFKGDFFTKYLNITNKFIKHK